MSCSFAGPEIKIILQFYDGLEGLEKSITDEKLRKMCDTMDRSGDEEVKII